MSATDQFKDYSQSLDSPAINGFNVTPTDGAGGVFQFVARGLYVGTTGNVTLIALGNSTQAGQTLTFANVPAGTILPIRCTQVNATNTTASNIIGLI